MRKAVVILLSGGLFVSCVTTTKVYRNPNYKMNKRDTVYIERATNSFIYSDAQLENTGNVVTAIPDKRVAVQYPFDSILYKELSALRYKPTIVDKGGAKPKKGLVISYRDYWVNEADPAFFRFWLKGESLKDSSVSMVYEGAPVPSSDGKPSPDREIRRSILELITPGMEQEPDENDFYLMEDETMLPKSKFYASVNFGMAKLFGNSYNNLLPDEKTYKEGLNRGTAIMGDLAYFYAPYYGAGVSLSIFNSAKSRLKSSDENKNSLESSKVHIFLFGPSLYARNLMFKGRMSSILSVSGGYLKYSEDQTFYATDYTTKVTSSGVGAKLGLSLEYLAHKNVGVGLSGGLVLGRLEVKNKLAPLDQQVQKLWLNHFTLGVGVRFYY